MPDGKLGQSIRRVSAKNGARFLPVVEMTRVLSSLSSRTNVRDLGFERVFYDKTPRLSGTNMALGLI